MAIEAIINEVRKLDCDLNELDRRLVALEVAIFGTSGSHWHRTYEREDWLIGELGVMVHVLDPVTKRAISSGFHDFAITSYGFIKGFVGAEIRTAQVDPSFKISKSIQD